MVGKEQKCHYKIVFLEQSLIYKKFIQRKSFVLGISPWSIALYCGSSKRRLKIHGFTYLIICSCWWFGPLLKEFSLQAKSITNIQPSSLCFCVYHGLPQKLFTFPTSTITFTLLLYYCPFLTVFPTC